MKNDPTVILTQGNFAGQVEIPKARWRDGFKFAQVVDGKKLEKRQSIVELRNGESKVRAVNTVSNR